MIEEEQKPIVTAIENKLKEPVKTVEESTEVDEEIQKRLNSINIKLDPIQI